MIDESIVDYHACECRFNMKLSHLSILGNVICLYKLTLDDTKSGMQGSSTLSLFECVCPWIINGIAFAGWVCWQPCTVDLATKLKPLISYTLLFLDSCDYWCTPPNGVLLHAIKAHIDLIFKLKQQVSVSTTSLIMCKSCLYVCRQQDQTGASICFCQSFVMLTVQQCLIVMIFERGMFVTALLSDLLSLPELEFSCLTKASNPAYLCLLCKPLNESYQNYHDGKTHRILAVCWS